MLLPDCIAVAVCTRCGYVKPQTLEYFPYAKRRASKLSSWCRKCSVANSCKWQREKPEYVNTKHRERYWKNPEKSRADRRQYYLDNPDKRLIVNAQAAQRRTDNYQDELRKEAEYRATHKPQIKASNYKWEKANPDKVKAKRKRNKMRHPDKNRRHKHNRRARIRNLPYTLTDQEWEDVKAYYNYGCAYCGTPWYELDSVLEEEHIIPTTQGGGYTKENIVPGCRGCNARKNNRTPEQVGMKLIKPWPI